MTFRSKLKFSVLKRAFVCGLVWLVLGSCEREPAASLLVVVDSNYPVPSELSLLRVSVHDEDSGERLLRRDLELSNAAELPLTVELAGGDEQTVRVVVEARNGDKGPARSMRVALTQLVLDRRLFLPMFLARHCSWTEPCGEGETCTEDSTCDTILIAPENLAEAPQDVVLDLPFDPAACGQPCREPTCGNGDDSDPGEVCDDGNRDPGDGCRADCAGLELCGDGIVDKEIAEPEECDDGNAETEVCEYGQRECLICDEDCKLQRCDTSYCGDGRVADGEVCDDGNTEGGDGCRADCGSELRCGDGVVDDTMPLREVCDDGNTRDCDGCSADCRMESGCGDGVVCPGEVCEPGLEGSDCRADCLGPRQCGDGFLDADLGEQCDDGDRTQGTCPYAAMSCTVCGPDCQQIPGSASYCGDGVLDPDYESCDWAVDADCRGDCTRCGDGRLDSSEECDEGGEFTSTCSSVCTELIFHDDMEGDDPGWTVRRDSGTVDVPLFSWVSGQRANSGNSARYSGAQPGSDSPGDAQLLSPVIDVVGLQRVVISFAHHYEFDRCAAGPMDDLDGGFVEVFVDGVRTLVAPGGGGREVFGTCGPLPGQAAFVGSLNSDAFERVTLEVDVAGASTLQVWFHVRWDCQGALGCATSPEPGGWYIDDVGIAPVAVPSPTSIR